MLIDSDVLIWLTRGHVGAAKRLQAIDMWRISAVTYIELAQGCRDKADLARLKRGLAARDTEIVPVTPVILQRAVDLIDALALYPRQTAPRDHAGEKHVSKLRRFRVSR